MKLPKNLLSQGTYTKPRLFLCETDKTRICKLDASGLEGVFKFNSISELDFEVARIYNDIISGEIKVNPFYDKIEALRLVELENFGYFEIQGPELEGDGIKESKSINAKSLEYTLSQKYLENFYINTGEIDSVEVIYGETIDAIIPVRLYWPERKELSLLDLILEKVYGWKIGHVDESLKTLSRKFEIDRMSVYDFIMNEICEKFNCYAVFDTINNTINLYAESLTSKFISDGTTTEFIISPPFNKIGSVSIEGYKTTKWNYDIESGILRFDDAPAAGEHIEVVDGALEKWETDVFITFDNLSQEVNVKYDADEIKTVLSVTYGEDEDIRESNLGLSYLTDISYYYTVDWMGQDLYDAYTNYLQKTNECRLEYIQNSKAMLELANKIDWEENRLSLEYSLAQNVDKNTIGTYYVRGGTAPNYYYSEVSLPQDYHANTDYYSTETTNVNENKVKNLYEALRAYFVNGEGWEQEFKKIENDFRFMEGYTLNDLVNALKSATTQSEKDSAVLTFFGEMWNEIGRTPLEMEYYEPYKKVQITNIEAGWSDRNNENYWHYYPVVLILDSIDSAIKKREVIINEYKQEYSVYQQNNQEIADSLLMSENFTEQQLIRLSAFLREDELHLDDIVQTDLDTLAESFKIKEDAVETGRIELNKMCQPKLEFSMDMANIYALPEFEPIIDQFQLGNVIKVGIRSDYIKQSRLMEVKINFEDFSDFSCEFGELTSLRSQSDIHADLLKQAVQAGKSVANNSSYWTQGSDKANSIDIRLQEGLLNSIEALKSIDGTQDVSIDKYGVHLQKIDPVTGEADPRQAWLVNNQFVFTDDGFKTTKAALGEFTVEGETYYGLVAQAVLAGYIEGSQIKGGTIRIGEQADGSYAFEVYEDGSVTMGGGNSIEGYAKLEDVEKTKTHISDAPPSEPYEGQLWLDTSTDPSVLKTWNGSEWVQSVYQQGNAVYTSRPYKYSKGDIWILAPGESNGIYQAGSILKAEVDSDVFDGTHWVDADANQTIYNIRQTFEFNPDEGLFIRQQDKKFYAQLTSTEMSFVDNTNDDEPNKKVVSISNHSATIRNAIVEDNAEFNCDVKVNGNIFIPGFAFVEESNGSVSLVAVS